MLNPTRFDNALNTLGAWLLALLWLLPMASWLPLSPAWVADPTAVSSL